MAQESRRPRKNTGPQKLSPTGRFPRSPELQDFRRHHPVATQIPWDINYAAVEQGLLRILASLGN
jgi:hypothetical protein